MKYKVVKVNDKRLKDSSERVKVIDIRFKSIIENEKVKYIGVRVRLCTATPAVDNVN